MAQFKKAITKHPSDCDETLDAILQDIETCNRKGDRLVAFSIQPDDVILVYEAHDSSLIRP